MLMMAEIEIAAMVVDRTASQVDGFEMRATERVIDEAATGMELFLRKRRQVVMPQ
jgi:hypothetical protein